jgi:hypothetical protein
MVKIPPKNKVKEWENLRDSVNLNRIRHDETHRMKLMERKRWLERRIKELEEEQPSANRDYLLHKYRQELCESA